MAENGHHRINIFHIPGKPAGIKNVMNFKKQEVTVACITVGLSGESDRQPGCIRGRIKKNREMTVTNGAIVIHTQRLKSDPGGNLLS